MVGVSKKCYYGDSATCGPSCGVTFWKCKTCKETYCGTHWHETSKGYCVECVACERVRKDKADAVAKSN